MSKELLFLTGTVRGRRSLFLLMAEEISKRGYNVTLITGYPNIGATKEYRDYQLKNSSEEVSPTLKILRVGTKRREPKSLLLRAIRGVLLSRQILRTAMRQNVRDCVIYSTPPFMGNVGAKLAKRGFRTIYLAQDLFPDTLFAIHKHIEQTFLGKYLRKKELTVYSSNTYTVTISYSMKEHMVSLGANSDRISVIYNWADVEALSHIDRKDNSLFDDYQISRDMFIVSFAGNLGRLQNIEILLDVAKLFKNNSNVSFVIFGHGAKEQFLKNRIEEEEISNVYVLPIQPPEKVSEVYSFGDLEFVCVEEGVMDIACPHKMFDIFSVGSPILAMIDRESDMSQKIIENRMGFVVSNNIDDFYKIICNAYENKESLRQMGDNARKFAESISLQRQIDKYLTLINHSGDE